MRGIPGRRHGAGQSMVEFGMTFPLLLMILLGLIEAARWMHAYLAVQYAAREAARFAVTGNPPLWISGGEGSCEALGHPVTGDPYNLPDEYLTCRVDWITYVARGMAREGLLVEEGQTDVTKPYYLGVQVRGSPSFGGAPQLNHPGVARTKVEVMVIYNHPVVNPLMAALLPTIRVVGMTQMVNEPWEGGGPDKPPDVPPAPPLAPLDTDGDGWNDIDERDLHGTLPSNPDTDGDGYYEGDGTLLPTEPLSGQAPLDPCNPEPDSPACQM
jgi:hypothetical protein